MDLVPQRPFHKSVFRVQTFTETRATSASILGLGIIHQPRSPLIPI